MDFTKKKLQQEFDDKLETEQQSKRQVERKARKNNDASSNDSVYSNVWHWFTVIFKPRDAPKTILWPVSDIWIMWNFELQVLILADSDSLSKTLMWEDIKTAWKIIVLAYSALSYY